MDKNKNRTNLLAAGRKKLQQYRQKKDKGSGSQGKSTKKSGKSEQHEAGSKPTASSQVRDGGTESAVGSKSGIVNTPESNSVEKSADSDTSVAVVSPSTVPITEESNAVETELEKNAESPPEELRVSKPNADSAVQNEGESTGTADAEVARDNSLDTSHTVDSGGDAENLNTSVQVDESVQHAPVDITGGMSVTVESEIPNSVADVGPSAVPVTQETTVVETALEKNAKSPSDEVGVSKLDADPSVQNDGESTGTADTEVARDISLDTSHTVDSGGDAEKLNMSVQVSESAQHASVGITEGIPVTVELEIPSSGKESLPSGEDINRSSMHDREDQIEVQSETQLQSDFQHHRLLDETSLLRASLNELCEKNQSLAEELAQCRGELQAVAFEKEELENKFHTAKLEVEEASLKAVDLHNNLERAQHDVFRLSTELADCNGLVQALQVEKETLNETIVSADEVKSKLIDQNNLHLLEKEKLSTDLVDCERLVATLQGQISNLSGNLDSVTQQGEHLSTENEKLATELADIKNLVSALQVEIASLNGSLALVTEEKKKLEEEREYSAHENEKLLSDLVACESLVATLQVPSFSPSEVIRYYIKSIHNGAGE